MLCILSFEEDSPNSFVFKKTVRRFKAFVENNALKPSLLVIRHLPGVQQTEHIFKNHCNLKQTQDGNTNGRTRNREKNN